MQKDTPVDPRHVARAMALQYLFWQYNSDGTVQAPTQADLLETLESDNFDPEIYAQITLGVTKDQAEVDQFIREYAPTWPLEQIAPVDLVILRMGVWEAFVGKINPAKIAINEAIELAKQFGGENSSSFINGVLGSILKATKNDADTTTA